MKYTEDQAAAIDTRDKNILVAAAAGSGKTRVLVDRIIKQLLAGEFDVDEILVVTFTNAAAAEMLERIELALQEKLQTVSERKLAIRLEKQLVLLTGANISTFHAFCQKIIRQHIEQLDLDPQFRLANDNEMKLLRREVLEDLLEAKYQQPADNDEAAQAKWQAFVDFTDAYGNEQDDETIVEEAVLKLYHFSQSQPYPELWLKQHSDPLAVPWGRVFMREIRAEILAIYEDYLALYKKIVALMEDKQLAEAVLPYKELMDDELNKLEYFSANQMALFSQELTPESWSRLIQASKNVTWGALRGKKYKLFKDINPDLQNELTDIRTAIKKRFTDLQKQYFSMELDEIVAGVAECSPMIAAYRDLTIDFSKALQQAKKERNIVDFNDLEHFALTILCADPEKLQAAEPIYEPTDIAKAYQQQFKTIMVDEYQDTNGVQEAILNLIASPNNRFTVGDVKQSIYRFRLADPSLFQAKYESFPKDPQAGINQLITMRQNFRSRAEVLAPINYIFDQIMIKDAAEIEYDDDSKLYPGASYPQHDNSLAGPMEIAVVTRRSAAKATVESTENADDSGEDLAGFALEAEFIAQRITKLMEENPVVYDKDSGGYRPIQYRDIVILLRAVKGKADIMLESLRKNSIPAYADVGGGYFEASEVRLLLELLSIIDNSRQDIPLAAIMASPIGGFSMEEIVKIRLAAPEGDLYDGLMASFTTPDIVDEALAIKTAAFQQELASWRSYATSHSVPELIWQLYRETGYYDYVGSLKGGLLRQANLRMLADRAADYERTNYRGLFRFLRYMEALQKRDTDLSVARTLGASENVVRIMSIHKSKGLEFPVVIVADTAKKFNLQDAQGTFLMHKDLGISLKMVSSSVAGRQIYENMHWRAIAKQIIAESKAEEMRVLYVALTRAREKLIVTGTVSESTLAKRAATWCKHSNSAQKALPTAFIRNAMNSLDWIMAAVARHPASEVIHDLGDETASVTDFTPLELELDAKFTINIVEEKDVGKTVVAADELNEILQAAEKMQPMPASDAKQQVEKCLAWEYDERGLKNVPAKLTVTEIKQRFNDSDDVAETLNQLNTNPLAEIMTENRDWPRPKFLQQAKKGFSATERGTIMHTVMQHIDFNGDISFAGIKKQLAIMEQQGILEPDETAIIYIKGIQGFASSQLGKRLQQAKCVWRELPFSRMLDANRFYPEVLDDEQVFTQGVIDLLFEDADGKLVLVDYKTDRSSDIALVERRYQVQIDLYSEAVEQLLGRSVAERYLYLLQTGTIVPVHKKA